MKKIVYALLVLTLFTVFGCSDTNNYNYSSDALNYGPKGQVQGVLRDAVTNDPIVNAVIDIGFGTATTNGNGQFTLVNVPALNDALDPNTAATYSGEYTATINLAGANSKIKADYNVAKAANANTPEPYYYPAIDYQKIKVQFTSKNRLFLRLTVTIRLFLFLLRHVNCSPAPTSSRSANFPQQLTELPTMTLQSPAKVSSLWQPEQQ